jgi:hypothetical protein
MFADRPLGYVDLRRPAGIGLGALVYNYDGKVFASDEGRMLAEMGDRTFELDDRFHESCHFGGIHSGWLDSHIGPVSPNGSGGSHGSVAAGD